MQLVGEAQSGVCRVAVLLGWLTCSSEGGGEKNREPRPKQRDSGGCESEGGDGHSQLGLAKNATEGIVTTEAHAWDQGAGETSQQIFEIVMKSHNSNSDRVDPSNEQVRTYRPHPDPIGNVTPEQARTQPRIRGRQTNMAFKLREQDALLRRSRVNQRHLAGFLNRINTPPTLPSE